MKTRQQAISDVLLGTAVGDSLGLPAEGLSRSQIVSLGWNKHWRHRLIAGRGMLSDDTEHSVLVTESILASNASPQEFEKMFARRLRGWFLSAPPGIGLATLRACLKLSLGFPHRRCGVFSAGNGPAMRSGIIGAAFPSVQDSALRREFVKQSTLLTHTDPLALAGALVVAEITASATRGEPLDIDSILQILKDRSPENSNPWQEHISHFKRAVRSQDSVAEFATRIGMERGISGFIVPSVFVPIYALLAHNYSFPTGLTNVLNCGGDTDTCGAIYGAMAGAKFGCDSIPIKWMDGITDYPLSVSRLRKLAARFDAAEPAILQVRSIYSPWIVRLLRNFLLTSIAITHVVLRHLPGGSFLLRRLA